MKNKLTRNIGLKIMALLFAIILWMIAVDINDPVEKKVFSGVPVQLVNTGSITGQGKTYKVLNNTDSIRVTVRAKKTVLAQITENDITARADVSMLSYTNTVPIELQVDKYIDNRVESITKDKESVLLEIEDLQQRQLRIEVVENGSLPEGYVTGKIATETNTMSISGPASVVSQVDRAIVEIELDDATSNIDMVTPIRLLDSEGKEVNHADIHRSIESVKVTVPVLPTKETSVKAQCQGTPAEGYVQTGKITVSPNTVLLAGKESVLKEIASIDIPSTELDINGARGDVTLRIDIRRFLPSDVTLGDKSFNGLISVTVEIQPIRRRVISFDGNLVQLVNVPEGWNVEVEPEQSLKLSVTGLQQYLEPLALTDIVPHIDIGAMQDAEGNLPEGQVESKVNFLLPDNITQEDEVRVNLRISQIQTEEEGE